MKKWMRALGVALPSYAIRSLPALAVEPALAPSRRPPVKAYAGCKTAASVACLAMSAVLLSGVFASGTKAQDSSDAETYGRAVASMCKPAESVASCNARLTLIGTTVEKLHELAPTGILRGAYLAADPAGKPVICAYGWENNIEGDSAKIAFAYRLSHEGVGGSPMEVSTSEANKLGCGNPKAVLLK